METETLFLRNPQFEPGINAKKLWLYCRRKPTAIGSPGLLCSPAGWDSALFLLILLLEFIGLWLFYRYVGNLLFAVAFFAADITYAVSAHLVYGRMSVARNRIYLLHQQVKIHITRRGQRILTPSPEAQARRERRKLFLLRLYAWFFYLLIALLALFKMGGFIANWPGRDAVNSITVTICLTYVVVAALQIYATGHFAFTTLFSLVLGADLRKHRSRSGSFYARTDAGTFSGNRYEGIDLHTLLLTDPRFEALGYRHRDRSELPRFGNCTVRNHILHENRLYLYGVVTDEDLNAFTAYHANNIEGKQVLGLVLLGMQLERCILQGGIDFYTEPVPFPAGPVSGPGAVDAGPGSAIFSVARTGNDLPANRREQPGRGWEYVWEAEAGPTGVEPGAGLHPVKAVTAISGDIPSAEMNLSTLKPGETCYLTVHAKNLAEPFVRGPSSPRFAIRVLSWLLLPLLAAVTGCSDGYVAHVGSVHLVVTESLPATAGKLDESARPALELFFPFECHDTVFIQDQLFLERIGNGKGHLKEFTVAPSLLRDFFGSNNPAKQVSLRQQLLFEGDTCFAARPDSLFLSPAEPDTALTASLLAAYIQRSRRNTLVYLASTDTGIHRYPPGAGARPVFHEFARLNCRIVSDLRERPAQELAGLSVIIVLIPPRDGSPAVHEMAGTPRPAGQAAEGRCPPDSTVKRINRERTVILTEFRNLLHYIATTRDDEELRQRYRTEALAQLRRIPGARLEGVPDNDPEKFLDSGFGTGLTTEPITDPCGRIIGLKITRQ